MDRFMEQVVVKRRRTLDEVLYFASFAVMLVLGIIAMICLSMIFYQFSLQILILLLVSAGGAVFTWFYRGRLRTEYEYTFTNGDLDFAMVFNNSKRKNLGSLKVKNVEAFGKVSGQSFSRYISMPGVKQLRWFLNRDAELYYFFFQKEGSKKLLILEPNEELVDYIKHYLPFGALQDA